MEVHSLRVRLSMALALAALLVLVAIAPVLAQVTTVTMWFGRENFVPLDKFESFHAENPDIHVDFDVIPLEEVLAGFFRSAQARRAPDIFQTFSYFATQFSNVGWLLDISSILDEWKMEDEADFNDLSPATWDLASSEGVPYGMALHGSGQWHAYRVDVFNDAGIDAPASWEDVLNAARKLNSDDMVGWLYPGTPRVSPDFLVNQFVAAGGKFKDGLEQLDSEAGIYMTEWMQTASREQLMHPDVLTWNVQEVRAAWLGGRGAQGMLSANVFPLFQQSMEYGTEWKVKTHPHRPGGEDEFAVANRGFPYFVSFSAAGKEEAIKKVLQYLARPDITKDVHLRYQPTSRTSVFNDPEVQSDQPWWSDIIEALVNDTLAQPGHPQAAALNEILKDWEFEILTDTEADASEIVKKYQARIDELGM